MVNIIVFGDSEQEIKEVDVNQTVDELLQKKGLTGNYGIVYYGRMLKRDQRLSDLSGLQSNHKLYIIPQKDPFAESPALNPDEATKVSKSCLAQIENLNSFDEEKLLSYVYAKDYKEKLFNDFGSLIGRNMLIMNALSDLPSIRASLLDSGFVEKNPNFVAIVNSMLQKFAPPAASSSLFQALRQPAQMPPNPLAITTDMLRNAIAATLPAPEDLMTKFSVQLAQLREFGFLDDQENIVALEACGGNVESALSLIVSMREDGDA